MDTALLFMDNDGFGRKMGFLMKKVLPSHTRQGKLGNVQNDVPRFLAIFDLLTYLVLLYNVPFLDYLGPPYLP